jgi:hypothetical protein
MDPTTDLVEFGQNGWDPTEWMDPATDPTRFGQNGRNTIVSGWIQSLIQPVLAKMAGIWPNIFVGIQQRQPDVPDFGNNCIFTFCNFFVQIKCQKIFYNKTILR